MHSICWCVKIVAVMKGTAVYMGVEIGTTSTRAIAYGEDGELLAEQSESYDLYSPKLGWAEQDPEEIFEAVLGTLSRVVEAIKTDNRGEISGISFSTPSTPEVLRGKEQIAEQLFRPYSIPVFPEQQITGRTFELISYPHPHATGGALDDPHARLNQSRIEVRQLGLRYAAQLLSRHRANGPIARRA